MSRVGWSKYKVQIFVRDAIAFHREAWDLVPRLRTAIIAEKYAQVVSGQDETVEALYLSQLWTDMLEAAGLLGE